MRLISTRLVPLKLFFQIQNQNSLNKIEFSWLCMSISEKWNLFSCPWSHFDIQQFELLSCHIKTPQKIAVPFLRGKHLPSPLRTVSEWSVLSVSWCAKQNIPHNITIRGGMDPWFHVVYSKVTLHSHALQQKSKMESVFSICYQPLLISHTL